MAGFITAAGASYLMGMAALQEYVVDNYYVALTRGVPSPLMENDELGEIDADDYARAQIPADGQYWHLSLNTLSNTLEVSFPVPESDWGDVKGWVLLDDPDAGRVLFGGSLGVTWTILAGYQAVLSVGMLTFTIEVATWSEAT